MAKHQHQFEMPKSIQQLESLLQNIFKNNPNKHYIIRILNEYFEPEILLDLMHKYEERIVAFQKNKSIVWLISDFDYDMLPYFISVAPTEEEAIDIIDFEEIERDMFMEE